MPSHIFTRLGLWDESINSNLNSASSAQCYAGETEMQGHWRKEIHALDYLVYAYLQKGDNKNANEHLEYWNTINHITPSTSSPYNFGAIPIRMALENKQWSKAAQLSYHDSNLQWDNFPWEKSLLHFARGLGASYSGDTQKANVELDSLNTFYNQLLYKENKYGAAQVLIQIKTVQGMIQYANGNNDNAIRMMEEAAELEEVTGKHPVTPGEVLPARELLGDLYLAINKPTEALVEYEKNLARSPNRFNGLYGAASAAKKIGDTEKATQYFENLVALTEGSNSDRPELTEALEYLKNTK